MNPLHPSRIVLVAALSALAPGLLAQSSPDAPKEPREIRVTRARPATAPSWNEPAKPQPFLGVSVSKFPKALSSHLGLPEGMGLMVDAVTPDGPAAAVLKPHDVLTKFEDQLLVNGEQLSVLVRARKEGEEITLTYIRAGQTATTRVKLGTHTPPAFSAAVPALHWDHVIEGVPAVPGGRVEVRRLPGTLPRGEVDRTLSIAGRAPQAGGGVVLHTVPAPIARLVGVGDGNLFFSDDEGSLEIKTVDGRRELVAKGADDTLLFSGPITTEEERKALPEKVRARLQRFEGIETFRLRTEEHFPGGDVRVIVPDATPQSIVLPHAPAARRSAGML